MFLVFDKHINFWILFGFKVPETNFDFCKLSVEYLKMTQLDSNMDIESIIYAVSGLTHIMLIPFQMWI